LLYIADPKAGPVAATGGPSSPLLSPSPSLNLLHLLLITSCSLDAAYTAVLLTLLRLELKGSQGSRGLGKYALVKMQTNCVLMRDVFTERTPDTYEV
jgi:hypothetical protein